MRVDQLMETQVHTCSPQTNLETVAMAMWDSDCGSIPVVDDNGLPVGMITDRDISMSSALNHQPLWNLSAEQVANNRKVFTCSTDDSLETALEIMQSEQIRRLPVVNQGGELQGILSMDDLILAAQPKKTKSSGVSFAEVMTTLKQVCNASQH